MHERLLALQAYAYAEGCQLAGGVAVSGYDAENLELKKNNYFHRGGINRPFSSVFTI